MLKLSPRVYKTNAQLTLVPNNNFDTVKMHPILAFGEDLQVVYSTELNTATVNLTELTLPISNAYHPTHYRYMLNTDGDKDYAKARVECVMAEGKIRCVLDEPIKGQPIANIMLAGRSSALTRGSKTYSSYPSTDQLFDGVWSLADWVAKSPSRVESDSLLWEYSKTGFSMNPWIGKIVPFVDQFEHVHTSVKPKSVLTDWIPSEGIVLGHSYAKKDNWQDEAYMQGTVPTVTYYVVSPNADGEAYETLKKTLLPLQDRWQDIHVNVVKASEREYDIEWTAPVRLAYAAASRSVGILGATYEGDNYAFVDSVTSITIELAALPSTTEVTDLTYGLDSSGSLVSYAPNKNVIDINAEEALNVDAVYQMSTKWSDALAQKLLTKYRQGKYVFCCDVPAKWAVDNAVHVDTQMYVQLHDGNLVSRKNTPCVFQVKNITKTYKNSNFIFTLKLLEV